MRSILLSLVLIVIVSPVRAQQTPEEYLSDMPKKYPLAYKHWQDSLPTNFGDWINKLNGVVAPLKDITIGGISYKFGTTCVEQRLRQQSDSLTPFTCADNIAGVMFTTDQNKVIAVIEMHSDNGIPTYITIGRLTEEELHCIEYLVDDPQLTSCE